MNAQAILDALGAHRFPCGTEAAMQVGVAGVFEKVGIAFAREHRFSAEDRVDFFVDGVAVELKIKGSVTDILRQLHRYAQHESVREVLLVTTRNLHRDMPPEMNGKPVRVLVVGGIFA